MAKTTARVKGSCQSDRNADLDRQSIKDYCAMAIEVDSTTASRVILMLSVPFVVVPGP